MALLLHKKVISMIILVGSFNITACTTYQAVDPLTTDFRFELNVGDKVKITTKDGKSHNIKIVSISPDAINTTDEAIPISEIETLELRYFDAQKTATLFEVIGDVIIIIDAFSDSGVGRAPSC